MKNIELTINVNKIPSVNKLYGYNPISKRKFLLKEGKMFKNQMYREMYEKTIDKKYKIDPKKNIKSKFTFYLKENFNRRDLSNMVKAAEDSVFEFFKLNDNRVIKSTIEKKMQCKEKKHETIEVKLTLY